MDRADKNRGRASTAGERHVCAWEGRSDSIISRGDYKKRKEGAQMKPFSAACPFKASDFLVSCIKHSGLPLKAPRGQNPVSKLLDGLFKDYVVRAKTGHDHSIIRPVFQELLVF